MTRVLLVLDLLLMAAPAAAWTCPHGQMLRVHMHKCVGLTSTLARHFEGRRFVRAAPAPDNDRDWYVEITKLPPLTEDEQRADAVKKLEEELR